MSTYSLAVTIALSALTVISDCFLKRAGQAPDMLNLWFALGMGLYTVSAFGWVYVFRHLTFAEVGVIYSVSTMLLLTLSGVLFFKETLKASEYAGIACAVVSILLLKRFA